MTLVREPMAAVMGLPRGGIGHRCARYERPRPGADDISRDPQRPERMDDRDQLAMAVALAQMIGIEAGYAAPRSPPGKTRSRVRNARPGPGKILGLSSDASGIYLGPEALATGRGRVALVGYSGLADTRNAAGVNTRCGHGLGRYALCFCLAVSGLRIRTRRNHERHPHGSQDAERTPPRWKHP